MKFAPTFIIALLGMMALLVVAIIVGALFLWIAGVFVLLLLLGIRSGMGEISSRQENYFMIAIVTVIGLTLLGMIIH
jgi:uncharacterized membrane protein YqhA